MSLTDRTQNNLRPKPSKTAAETLTQRTAEKVPAPAEQSDKPRKTTIYLDADLYETLRQLAHDERTSTAEIIKTATRGYVADPSARARLEGIATEDGTTARSWSPSLSASS